MPSDIHVPLNNTNNSQETKLFLNKLLKKILLHNFQKQ